MAAPYGDCTPSSEDYRNAGGRNWASARPQEFAETPANVANFHSRPDKEVTCGTI
jgi:hypothetical protein